ncbi:MAG TPA: hypothetical protein VF006_18715 [Longimicrobium sp.]
MPTWRTVPQPVREHAVAAASVLIVLLCTAFILHTPPPASIAAMVGVPSAPGGPGYTALVVFQEKDCESNLQMLRLFQRPRLRPAFQERGILLASGRGAGDARLRALVSAEHPSFPFRLGTERDARTLHALGMSQTPYLIVLDGAGRVRYSTPAPAGPTEYVALARDLEQLASQLAGGAPGEGK